MALIKCPECGRDVSDKSKQCVHCGFPLDQIKSTENTAYAMYLVDSINKNANIILFRILLEEHYNVPKNEANHIIVEYHKGHKPIKILDGVKFENIEYIKKDFEHIGFFVKEEKSNCINDTSNYNIEGIKYSLDSLPKCPTCGSTNIEKISVSKKFTSGILFGLFSSNNGKTFHCKSCGYKW